MNIAGLQWDAVNAYDGVAVEIYPCGCYRNCKGCHNPQLQNFNYGKPLKLRKLVDDLSQNEAWFDIISIIGGDLLAQPEYEAEMLAWTLRCNFPEKKLWLFTGSERQDIPKWCYKIFDVIKYGSYRENLRDESYELASTNQRFIRKGVDY